MVETRRSEYTLISVAIMVILFSLQLDFTFREIGIHDECKDGIDNDEDGDTDFGDDNCIAYPYWDGNGESHTPVEDRKEGARYYESHAWNVYLEYWTYGGVEPCLVGYHFDANKQSEAFNAQIDYASNNCA